MNEIIKQLIPPLLIKIIKKSFFRSDVYNSYDEAMAQCSRKAYENPDVVRVVIEKNIIYKQKIQNEGVFDLGALRTLIALGLSKTGKSLNVIDFGGGGGYHYTIASNALGDECELKWNVVETTAMVHEAKRMADRNLNFYDNIDDAKNDLGDVDLVFTSGALHCCPEPIYYIKELVKINAKYLFITRTSFTESQDKIINIHKSYLSTNGPGYLPAGFKDKVIYYPNVFAPRREIEKIILEKYNIKFRITEEKSVYIAGNEDLDLFGYFCIRRD